MPAGMREAVGSTEGVKSVKSIVGVAVARAMVEAVVGVTPGAFVAVEAGVRVAVGVAGVDPELVGTGVLIVAPPPVVAVRGPSYS